MDLLLALQNLRNPICDFFFLFFTRLGEETAVLVAVLLFYWCLDKRVGLRLVLYYFAAGWLSQLLKLIFLIPRPFVLDARIVPHPSAMESATGYSFPSIHTTGAAAMALALGKSYKKRWLWLCLGLYVLVIAFSRLYLGVHAPKDVLAPLLLAPLMCLIAERAVQSLENPKKARLFALLGASAAIVLMIFAFMRVKLSGVEEALAADAFKTAGLALGMVLALYLERRFLNFDPKAVFWQQAVKLLLGTVLALLLKEGLKLLLGTGLYMQALRYGLLGLFVLYVWPALFTAALGRIARRPQAKTGDYSG